MKNFGKLFLAACLAMGLAACSNEEGPAQAEQLPNPDGVFMSLQIKMPVATRSTTDEIGKTPSDADMEQENGSVVESAVKSVQLLLVNPDNQNIIAVGSAAVGDELTDPKDPSVKVPALDPQSSSVRIRFASQPLMEYADKNREMPMQVYALCNAVYGGKTTGKFDANKIVSAAGDELWNASGFPMSNAAPVLANLPIQSVVLQAVSPETPIVLGGVPVERLASRFDVNKDNLSFDMEVGGKKEVKIVLDEVGVFNVADAIYLFRRTNNDLLGQELTNNYVLDCAHGLRFTNQPVWKTFASLDDKDDPSWVLKPTAKEYYRLDYAVENTFGPEETPMKEAATGVAFKGHLEAGAQCPDDLKRILEANKGNIYVLENVLYGDWNRLVDAAYNTPGEGQTEYYVADPKFQAAFALAQSYLKADNSEATTPEQIAAKQAKAAKNAGFQVLYPTDGKFHVNYTYYNKHNEDAIAGNAGIMEFGVVRNNVYKLKVNTIKAYGEPEWKEEVGPIPIENAYFQVSVEILPWTVRVNDIDF